jgi:hypothetical protein
MRAELLQMAVDLTRREEPFVLAVVVRRRPASSALAGDMGGRAGAEGRTGVRSRLSAGILADIFL